MLSASLEELREYPLSYAKISTVVGAPLDQDPPKHGCYEAYWMPILGVHGFVFLHRTEANQYQIHPLLKTRSSGYKIHVAIYDPNDDDSNLEQAWDIFVKQVIKHGIYQVKIIAPDFRKTLRDDSHSHERGKEITIYSFKEARLTEVWQLFFEEVTKEFVAHEIIPGPLPPGDFSVKGSSYFSYRNDAADSSLWDPFETISLLHITGQLERIKIKKEKTEGEEDKAFACYGKYY